MAEPTIAVCLHFLFLSGNYTKERKEIAEEVWGE